MRQVDCDTRTIAKPFHYSCYSQRWTSLWQVCRYNSPWVFVKCCPYKNRTVNFNAGTSLRLSSFVAITNRTCPIVSLICVDFNKKCFLTFPCEYCDFRTTLTPSSVPYVPYIQKPFISTYTKLYVTI